MAGAASSDSEFSDIPGKIYFGPTRAPENEQEQLWDFPLAPKSEGMATYC